MNPGVKITLKKSENKDDFGMGKLSLADKGNDGTCNAGLITVNVVYNRFKISHRKNFYEHFNFFPHCGVFIDAIDSMLHQQESKSHVNCFFGV